MILKITEHQEDFKISALVNTVSVYRFPTILFLFCSINRFLNWNVSFEFIRRSSVHIKSTFLLGRPRSFGCCWWFKTESNPTWNIFQNSTGKYLYSLPTLFAVLRFIHFIFFHFCIHFFFNLHGNSDIFWFSKQKLGVPLEGKVRVQLNLKVDQSIYISSLKNFRSFMFPIIWVEEVGFYFYFCSIF